ncbi:MAG: SgcJ/EcaC family oxidoreductase [Bryobacterales bacterium]|nr:SgcJ/EcaC family oxidoreductase [Bryobacterales bacterium]
MRVLALSLALLVLLFTACTPGGADERAAVMAVLEAQQAAWNAGDLAGFLEGYERTAEITFVGREVSRGYDGLEARYRRAYGTREQMGTLTFSELEFRPLGPGVAFVIGRFALARTEAGGGPATGRFTLVLRKTADGWKAIHDHTSAD